MASIRRTRGRPPALAAGALLALSASGCGILLGIDQYSDGTEGTSSPTSTSSSGTGGGTGGAPACTKATEATDCDDENVCTDDACGASGTCEHTFAKAGATCGEKDEFTCDGAGVCLDGHTLWANRYGDGNGEQQGEAIVADKDGNVIVAGYFKGALDFGVPPLSSPTKDAAFLAKLDPSGKTLWSQMYGDPNTLAFGNAVAVDASGNVLFGGTIPGSPLIKLDPQGNELWKAPFTPADMLSKCDVRRLAVAPNGDVLAAGKFIGTVDFGDGNNITTTTNDAFVARLSSLGQLLWVKTYKPGVLPNSINVNGIAVGGGGRIVFGGTLAGTVDFGSGPVTSAGRDGFLVFLDPAGNYLDRALLGDAANQELTGLALDASGNILIAGSFEGTIDFGFISKTSAGMSDGFVAKLSQSDGKVLWATSFGDADEQGVTGVAVDAAGNVLVTGDFLGTVDFGGGPITGVGAANMFLAKYSTIGKHLWSHAYVTALANAIAADPGGNVLTTGTFVGATDFGLGVLMTVGPFNVFVAKMAP